ncbi:hypothetical protein ACH8E3_02365 [Paenibacillus sp. CMAA1364]
MTNEIVIWSPCSSDRWGVRSVQKTGQLSHVAMSRAYIDNQYRE